MPNHLDPPAEVLLDPTLVPPAETGPVEVAASDTAWLRDKARALFDLSRAVDRVAPLNDPKGWIALAGASLLVLR
jgi:hypothetical protein